MFSFVKETTRDLVKLLNNLTSSFWFPQICLKKMKSFFSHIIVDLTTKKKRSKMLYRDKIPKHLADLHHRCLKSCLVQLQRS